MVKKISFLINFIFLGFIAFCIYNYFLFEEKVEELEEEISDLISEKNDLLYELEEEIEEKEKYQRLFNEVLDNQEEILELNSYNNSNYSTNNSYSNTDTSFNNIDLSSIETIFFDGGGIVKPSFNNLHLILDISQNDFVKLMKANNYSKTSDGSYVNSSTDNCCYSIVKDYFSVSMIFTSAIKCDVEEVMKESNISSNYDNGFKKYNYSIDNKSYQLSYQSAYDRLLLVLKRI
jgi:hypothetical protein